MSDIELMDQETNTFECPSCGNNSYHLEGMYVTDNFKYRTILTVVNCEYCSLPFGKMNSFGKGTDILDYVKINRLSKDDWKKIL